jgi:hypothetical protein
MTFLQPLLLGGLLLVGLPIVLHLIMQQKPKRLPFPAFRFLAQKQRTNTRSIRLRHLLLLLLRMLIIACLCFALARPKVFNDRFSFGGGQPVAAALVFDTSMSMEYNHNGKTRLEDAQQRARELLDDMPAGSRVAIFDSGEPLSGEWVNQLNLARDRVGALQLRPNAGSLADGLLQAYRLLADLDNDPEVASEPLPRFLYVFSDRTQECWDASRLPALKEARERIRGKLPAVFVDVGVDQPVDVAITDLEAPRQRVPANRPVVVKATIQATGQDCETEILCRFNGDQAADRKPVRLRAGQGQTVTFERGGLQPGVHQVEISLATTDNLPSGNARFASVEVSGPRQILTVADNPEDAHAWRLAIDNKGTAYKCDVLSTDKASALGLESLAKYQVVCLLSVRDPGKLWSNLGEYVKNGGGLVVIPGADLSVEAYDSANAKVLLPGKLTKLAVAKGDGVTWNADSYAGPVKQWARAGGWSAIASPPTTTRFWDVDRVVPSAVIARYNTDVPALLEQSVEGGKVLLFTTPLDRHLIPAPNDPAWNNYATSWFFPTLAIQSVGYLAGADLETKLNFRCGERVVMPLPTAPRFPSYSLAGPGVVGQSGTIVAQEKMSELVIGQAAQPGNYTINGPSGPWQTGFSLNVAPGEAQLSRVPAEKIEELFGPDSILPVGHAISLRDAIQGHWSQPVELFPSLMILLLIALALENLLANKFYRRTAPATDTPAAAPEKKS